jgi:hypothetical protein
MTGQRAKNFLSAWGVPTRTEALGGDSVAALSAGHDEMELAPTKATSNNQWTDSKGDTHQSEMWFRKGRTYDIWEYDQKKVTLAFYRGELVAWRWHDTNQLDRDQVPRKFDRQ